MGHMLRHLPLPFILVPSFVSAQYTLQTDYFATSFFDSFNFYSGVDPTNGFVSYTGRDDSLISSSGDNAQMRVSTEQSTPNGRPSIRIESKEAYDTGLIIIDVKHMPGGICGTWPAFWTYGPNWPNGGEIDIIEGVNDVQTNQATLHTGSTCTISSNSMSGTLSTDNCDVSGGSNTGCGVTTDDTSTYGTAFNNNGGGVYATLITSANIVIWFWPRSSIPGDVLGSSPDPSTWSTPFANFSGNCDIETAFAAQNIVFDTTFCGDWAGATWSGSSCASKATTCNDYVANNGADFEDAYWSINALKVFQDSGTGPAPTTAASAPAAPTSAAPPPPPQSTPLVTASAPAPTTEAPPVSTITVEPATTASVLPTPSTVPPPSTAVIPAVVSTTATISTTSTITTISTIVSVSLQTTVAASAMLTTAPTSALPSQQTTFVTSVVANSPDSQGWPTGPSPPWAQWADHENHWGGSGGHQNWGNYGPP